MSSMDVIRAPSCVQDAVILQFPSEKHDGARFVLEWRAERSLRPEWGRMSPHERRVHPEDSAFLGGSGERLRCFQIWSHAPDGSLRPGQIRYDTPNKDWRYRGASGPMTPFAALPDSFRQFELAEHKNLAEGPGKVMSLIGAAHVATVGIYGCRAWHSKGADALLPEIAERIRPGDTVDIWPDGDWRTNRNVHIGYFGLLHAVVALGATARLVDLPDIPGVGKVGVDDLIKTWRDAGRDVATELARLPRLEVAQIPNPFTVNLKDPLKTAENFLDAKYSDEQYPTLAHWQKEFFTWVGCRWEMYAGEKLRQDLYYFVRENGKTPNDTHVNKLVDALRSAAQIRIAETPAWISEQRHDGEILPVANGLLCTTTGELLPPTPQFFNVNASDVKYDTNAQCPRWLQFLEEIYPGDAPSQRKR